MKYPEIWCGERRWYEPFIELQCIRYFIHFCNIFLFSSVHSVCTLYFTPIFLTSYNLSQSCLVGYVTCKRKETRPHGNIIVESKGLNINDRATGLRVPDHI